MQSVESTSSQASPDCLNFGEEDFEVFQSDDEGAEVTGGDSISALSSSVGLGWSSTEQEKENKTVGGTQGDLLFAKKCLELQGFIRPLLELLNGLKKGRFDKGLSSFQQSVAMDRIQRIVGVLQKPHIGEKYLPTLLQIEMMLKLWFPQVNLQPKGTSVSRQLSGQGPSSSSTPPHKQKDQLHIPVKKRRLSWSDAESSLSPTPVACKCFHIKGQEKEEQSQGLSFSTVPASHVDQSNRSNEEISGTKGLRWADPSLTWVHVAPILSPPKSCPSLSVREDGGKDIRNGHFLLTPPPPASRGSPAMQDNSISSTTPCSEQVMYQIQPELVTQTEGRNLSSSITVQLKSLLQS